MIIHGDTARAAEVEHLLARIVAWAAGRDVQGVALVGSWARGAARPDSDVDVVVLTTGPQAYATGTEWIADACGQDAPVLRTAAWGPLIERRVRLASGLEVEFGFALPAWAAVLPADPGTARVVRDGCRPLHDPQGLLGRLVTAVG